MTASMRAYQGLDAEFRAKLTEFERRLEAAGIRVKLTCGFRSIEEQNRLYVRGRTAPGRVVTNARGGSSWHNYGLAADYAFVVGGQFTWSGPWRVFGRIARECGLEWGGDWSKFPDRPHIQWRKGRTLTEMRRKQV